MLWFHAKPSEGFSLLRDSLYWLHRYTSHPLAKYQYFCIRQKGHLIGIAVTRLFSSKANNQTVSIVEWMVDQSSSLGLLLLGILDFYKKAAVNYYYLWVEQSGKDSTLAMKNLFLLKRNAPIIFANTTLFQQLNNAEPTMNFYLGSADAI